MSHSIFICPDSLLNNSKLPLPELLVHVDGVRLDDVLGRDLVSGVHFKFWGRLNEL